MERESWGRGQILTWAGGGLVPDWGWDWVEVGIEAVGVVG